MAAANQNLKNEIGIEEHEIDIAIEAALARLEGLLPRFTDFFATPCTTNFRYKPMAGHVACRQAFIGWHMSCRAVRFF